ncbi:MAG: hypothetical protein LBJ31_03175 [Treponema sp.]|jgi:hypothetical protein|nr:hypothetical protein [Treponema sp.]
MYRPKRQKNSWFRSLRFWLRLTALAFTLFLALPAFGRGKREAAPVRDEAALAQADQLIAEKRYTEATTLLAAYARRYPNDFASAQLRQRRINGFKEEYNTVAQQLLDVLENTPEDEQLIIALTNLLIELDPQRIAETQDFIIRTREVALFRVNRRRLETILVQAQGEIDRGGLTQALRAYAGGLDIYQIDFFRSGFGTAIETRGRQGIAALNLGVTTFNSILSPLENALRDLESQTGQSFDQNALTNYRNAYNRVSAELERLLALRNSFLETELNFQNDLERIRVTNPEISTRNFLAFAVVLMEGRQNESGDGFMGVVDSLWNQSADRAMAALERKNQTYFLLLANQGNQRQYNTLENRSQFLAAYTAFSLDLLALRTRYGTAADEESAAIQGQRIVSSQALPFLRNRSLAASAAFLGTVGSIGTRYSAIAETDTLAAWRSGGDGAALMQQERNNTAVLRVLGDSSRTLTSEIRGEVAQYQGFDRQYPDSGALGNLEATQAVADQLYALIRNMESNSSASYYTIANTIQSDTLRAREDTYRRGSALMQGEVRNDGTVSNRPTEVANIMEEVTSVIDADIQSMDSLIRTYNAENADVLGSSQVSPLHDEALAMQSRFNQTRTQSRALEATARSRAAEAVTRRRDGDRILGEAGAALDQGNFTLAKERLLSATSNYDMSLELEDNPQLREERDSSIASLDARIAAAEYESVIQEVQTLVAQAEQDYWNGNFEQSEEKLLRAQSRWARTQNDEHPDIARWLGLTRNALAQRSTRTIPVTAPLYPEMSQLLSDAQKNFNEGVTFFNRNQNREGELRFNIAKANIQRVLLVYPANETAGILNLRIDQRIDPNFNTTFQQRLSTARALGMRGSLQGYYDLLVLQQINPQYPGLDQIIAEVEVAVGKRPPPPNPADLARARELVERARPIVLNKITAQTEDARGWLSEAIRLDSANQEARDLYRIAGEQTVTTATMTFEAERLYRQAVQAFTRQDSIQALNLIQQIITINPVYRNNPRVMELAQRVRSSG